MRQPMIVAALVLCMPITVAAQQSARLKVERSYQLPRHSYPLSTTAMALFQDDQQFAALAQQVAADLRADLGKYDIHDHATLKSYYGILGNLALERADYKTAIAYQDSIRAVEDKPGLRLSAGMLERALAAAARAPGEPLDTARFREAFRGEVAALPYPEGDVALTALKRRFELRPIPLRQVRVRIEPNAAASRSLTLELAQRLIAMRVERDRIASVRPVILAELTGIMASHKTATADIWPARDISLEGRTDLAPVTIGIWDSGVDVGVYPGQLYTNPGEIADNGKDDDGDGYVDDVHGIAYDLEHGRVTGLLYPLTPAELSEFRDRTKRASDRAGGLNAPEADTVRRSAAISSGDVPSPRLRAAAYGHGTEVAGVAVRGNPAARILVARISVGMGGEDPLEDPPTMEHARAFAQEFRESTEYFRKHGVRVVNMSWGFNPGVYEANLTAHNIGTPEERHRLARQLFDVVATALRDAISAAPNVLFVAAAGNLDFDVKFNETVPASFDLPNLITVGAVDAAGDETSFTNYGKVDVYANGYQVLSKAPGGFTIPADGTSLSAPQVVNLAAKLLAVKPTLTVAELRRAIIQSADDKTVGQNRHIRLLNPEVALERLIPAAADAQPMPASPSPDTAALVITKVTIIDVANGRRVADQAVVIRGTRIADVGTVGQIRVPAGARVVDGSGGFLVPGLWDMHVHMGDDDKGGPITFSLLVANGVTGARIMAGRPRHLLWRREIAHGALTGPRLVIAGPILEGPVPDSLAAVTVMDGKVVIGTPAEAIEQVRAQKAAGYDFIKVYNNLSRATYDAIVGEARLQGMVVAGHVPQAAGLNGVLAAHQASIEHLRGYAGQLVPADAPLRPGPDLRSQSVSWQFADTTRMAALAAATRRAGVWNCPTLAVRIIERPQSDVDDYLAAPEFSWWSPAWVSAWKDRRQIPFLANFSEADFRAAALGQLRQDALVRALRDAGAGILAGTDNSGPPGFSLHRELVELVRAGLTPLEALRAATLDPARFLGATDSLGSVAPGKLADLVLLGADPLADIRNIASIRGVVADGMYRDRADLDALLADVRHRIDDLVKQ